MAKGWYPVIDEERCKQCGTCVRKCSKGVYDKDRDPIPVVVYPDGCVDHCHGCGNTCPTGAITFAGEDTGWTPPAWSQDPNPAPDCCCSPAPKAKPGKELRIEYLYLDLSTCDRCIGTDKVLEEVLAALRPVLETAGYQITYRKQEITDPAMAEKFHFLSSPTILVNGRDIFGPVLENDCGCCGDIAGVPVDCRVFAYNGETYEVPTPEILMDAILKSLHAPPPPADSPYTLPENLKRFFAGKNTRSNACCGGTSSCC